MSRPLYGYYERELAYLRQSAREFAKQYPATAGRLLLEQGMSADPHVERLLEGAAFLAGRVRHKLDDDLPELTEALLSVWYPHFLAPVPSCAVVQFVPDPARVASPNGAVVPAGTPLRTQPVDGTRCRFRTAAPAALWPLALTGAEWLLPPFPRDVAAPPRAAAVLRLRFEASGPVRPRDLRAESLRIQLNAPLQANAALCEALLNDAVEVAYRDPDAPDAAPVRMTPDDAIAAGGFGPDEGLYPYPPHALPGYRLLTEFFTFPPKFWCVDLTNLQRARKAWGQRRFDCLIALRKTGPALEQAAEPGAFRLGAAPAVNLFEQGCEPVAVTQARSEYPVVPNVSAPLGHEVHTVTSVSLTSPSRGAVEFAPFYAVRAGDPPGARHYWAASRQASSRPRDRGSDVAVSLVDGDFSPHAPADGVLIVRALCTNRDLPERLRQAGRPVVFEPELALPVRSVETLGGPTAPLRPFGRRGYWRLVSHLTLSHLGLCGPGGGADALKGLLSLYDLSDGEASDPRSASARQAVDSIVALSSRPVTRRLGRLERAGFARGLEVDLQLDEEKLLGTGAFLFASVLERFFALHAGANSFTQLVARTRAGGEPLKVWAPRSGEVPLR